MPETDIRDKLTSYISDAVALEENVEQMLAGMISTTEDPEMRRALGTAVFSGMIGVTAFGLIFTPAFYVIARWLASFGPSRSRKTSEPKPH